MNNEETSSTIREDINDWVDCWLKGWRVLPRAYARLLTWKMNLKAGLPKTAYYDYKEETK